MSLYDGVKDLLKTVQKADNIELYKQLLDLGQQALDMQAEIQRLQSELSELKKKDDREQRIIRHKNLYITLLNDANRTVYCAHCWDNNQKLVQVSIENSGSFTCPHCHIIDVLDDDDISRW